MVSPQRPPRDADQASMSGHWVSPRLGRAVGHDSAAELHLFELLDAADDVVESYCEQPVEIPYRMYGHRHVYVPDALVDFRDGRRLLIEVKGWLDDLAVYENVVKFEAARRYCHAKGWGFVALTERLRTAADLLSRRVDDRAEASVRAYLAAGPTGWNQIAPLVREHHVTYPDIATLVLRNGWYWHKGPFRLSIRPLCTIAEMTSQYTVLHPHGNGHLRGTCPFCNSTAFIVRPTYGTFHCYRCGLGGDATEFLHRVAAL
jgi:DNA primase